MALKKFIVDVSHDAGVTWKRVTGKGWPIHRDEALFGRDDDGWTISITDGDLFYDVIISEDDLGVMVKQLARSKKQHAKQQSAS